MASIRQRPNGSWEVHFRDLDKRQRSRSFKRKVDARRFATEVEADKTRGQQMAKGSEAADTRVRIYRQIGTHLQVEQIERFAATLKLMAEPTRLRILLLLGAGERSVNQLADRLGQPPTAVSQHLARLRLGNLVQVRRHGNQRIYGQASSAVVAMVEVGLGLTQSAAELPLTAVEPGPPTALSTREAAVSLALGRLTAAAVLRDPEGLLERARQRIARSLADPDLPVGALHWCTEWSRLLGGPMEAVIAALLDTSERGYELRQNNPFTGVLSDDQRLEAVRQASREHRAARSA